VNAVRPAAAINDAVDIVVNRSDATAATAIPLAKTRASCNPQWSRTGTSLIAAEMTGRICCGLELSPAYVDVILRRWQTYTGRKAIHRPSGQSFDERAGGQDRDRSGSTDG
jgi:hypothetical protein